MFRLNTAGNSPNILTYVCFVNVVLPYVNNVKLVTFRQATRSWTSKCNFWNISTFDKLNVHCAKCKPNRLNVDKILKLNINKQLYVNILQDLSGYRNHLISSNSTPLAVYSGDLHFVWSTTVITLDNKDAYC